MRYLAIDLGDKRTGVAVGEDDSGIVTPIRVIEIPRAQEARLLDDLAREVARHNPGAIVVGLPLNMDGGEGPAARRAREFGAALAARVTVPVRFHDERLTTAEADWRMAGSGLTRRAKKARRDALAAAALLADYFSTRAGESPPGEAGGRDPTAEHAPDG